MISSIWEIIGILLSIVFLLVTTASKLSGSSIWWYVAIPTAILIIVVANHFIRKEIKYRKFCRDFWG